MFMSSRTIPGNSHYEKTTLVSNIRGAFVQPAEPLSIRMYDYEYNEPNLNILVLNAPGLVRVKNWGWVKKLDKTS